MDGLEGICDLEVEDLAAWTAGVAEDLEAIALIIRTIDGQQLGVMMPPAEAIKMGARLSRLGLRATPTANT